MAHFRSEVLQTREQCLKTLTKQRDIYGGAIACLNKILQKLETANACFEDTVKELDNAKRMLLMVGVDRDLPNMEDTPINLDQVAAE